MGSLQDACPYKGSFTLAGPDSDSCTMQILRERDLDPDLN